MRAPAVRWDETEIAGLPVVDIVVGALLLVVAIGTTMEMHPAEGPLGITLPVAVVMTTATVFRRRAPLPSLVAVVLASSVQAALGASPGTVWSFVVLMLAAYSVARCCTEGIAAVGGGLLVAGLWGQEWQDGGSDYLFIVLVLGGVWLLGRAVRRWQERATTAELNQDLIARNAVAEERVRIARELHDVVAHSLSVISVQANAAEAALEHDPTWAREPLGAIKLSCREALEEMRRMLALLRTDDGVPGAEPQQGLADLETLVQSVRSAGLPVETIVRGDARRLPAGVDVSAYRIVQEALTNVLRHAGPVATTVEVRYGPTEVVVRVVNALPPTRVPAHAPGGGHGLVGIRERVHAFGGELSAGVDEDGGYAVQARIPFGARP